MATRSKPVRTTRRRALLEQFAVGAPGDAPALLIDREKGIIYGARVLGRFSRNSHGLPEAENGTEYTRGCMESALSMYENAKVKINHPRDRSQPGKERDVQDTFGVLRNVRIESDEDGDPVTRADIHYRKHHEMTADVLDDIERRLGLWGLSHNAAAKRERFDRASKRLVIEELATVRSVDLVDKPATGRNLWESERKPMATTLRELLEGLELTPARKKWRRHLLEDDAMAPMTDVPVEADGGDEEDALWSGFQAAIQKVMDSYKAGECDAKEAGKKIADWIKAHDKLTGADEPEAPVEESDDSAAGGKKDKTESEELTSLRSEKVARELCESLGYTPTSLQIEAVAGIKNPKRQRELAESYKPTGSRPTGGFKPPKSAAPGSVGGDKKKPGEKPREVAESEAETAEELRILRG